MSESPWDRVAVIGSSGAGKSTLAARLSETLDSPHLELDALHFEPGWKSRPLEDFRTRVSNAVAQDRWVADINWRPVRDLVWSRATAIVWLDYPLATCFGRVLRRSLRRARTGEPVCGGNRETFRMTLASRDSILLWVLRMHAPRRRETLRDLSDPAWRRLDSVRLRSPAEADAWLASLDRAR